MLEMIRPQVKKRYTLRVSFLLIFLVSTFTACASNNDTRINQGTASGALPSATAITGEANANTTYLGEKISSSSTETAKYGVVVPDRAGSIVVISGKEAPPLSKEHKDARELKLKIRELAEQLIANVREASLRNVIAIPTSFVNLDAMDESSPLGRLIAEQLIYEFNQRGFPVKEFRIPQQITARKYEGEFYLTREISAIAPKSPGSVVIAGTYYRDEDAVFVNARIIKPSNGQVIRTANMVMDTTPMISRLTTKNAYKSLKRGTINITASSDGAPTISTDPFDLGADIHR